MLDVPLSVKTAEWRAKALAGELSTEELREFITLVRQGRVTAAVRSEVSRAKKAPINVDSMLDELDNL